MDEFTFRRPSDITKQVRILPAPLFLMKGKTMTDDTTEFNASGSKYLRTVGCLVNKDQVDVYAVLDAFEVTCPARQHAIKKLLCAGLRGKADERQDLNEAADALARAIEMHNARCPF